MPTPPKLCPLGFYSFYINKSNAQAGGCHQCVQERCALWETFYDENGEIFGQCGIMSMVDSLRSIAENPPQVERPPYRELMAANGLQPKAAPKSEPTKSSKILSGLNNMTEAFNRLKKKGETETASPTPTPTASIPTTTTTTPTPVPTSTAPTPTPISTINSGPPKAEIPKSEAVVPISKPDSPSETPKTLENPPITENNPSLDKDLQEDNDFLALLNPPKIPAKDLPVVSKTEEVDKKPEVMKTETVANSEANG